MPDHLTILAASALLTCVMVLAGSLIRARAWTPAGLLIAFGNRDGELVESPVAGRADRAGKNMVESMVMFTAVIVAAHGRAPEAEQIDLGAMIYFVARVAYWAVYLAGVPYVRTAVWFVGVIGTIMVGLVAVA